MKPELWQLRKLSTKENLNDPQQLPENWGPIFGLSGFKEKLGDLSWCGHYDKGWFLVSKEELDFQEQKSLIDNQVKKLLSESLEKVASDNLDITRLDREQWIEYRRLLKEIYLQPGYPYEVYWPSKPV